MNCKFPARRSYNVPLPNRGALVLGPRPLVMGIVNVTPDSFASPQAVTDPRTAIDLVLRAEAEGADLVDIGGESTRPGAEPVSAADELVRIRPVLEAVCGRLSVPVSVDTYKADVARAALDCGASLINDVSSLGRDSELAGVVAAGHAALVLMHTRGQSSDMYAQATYSDVVAEVASELGGTLARAVAAGVSRDRIIVDPGIGFAKRRAHSYGVLARLPDLAAALDRPLLVGPSRKSFMREELGELEPHERDWGTAAAITAAVLAGAHIVRVHAVGTMGQVVRVAEQIRRHQ